MEILKGMSRPRRSAKQPVVLHGGHAGYVLPAVAEFLRSHVRPGFRTLETGAGLSTLIFAERGAMHEVITPSDDERQAILAEAAECGIDTSRVQFHMGFSQDILPKLQGPLDLVLIDGGHGFPIPEIDWAYTAPRLRVGGLLLIDDIDLWTGIHLVEFLKAEPGWQYLESLEDRTAIFELTAPAELREWNMQPYVRAKSWLPQNTRRLRRGLRHVAHGEFSELGAKLRNYFDAT
ncbi:class I SAM-dependent methyltransferase [Mycobacterium sp. SM3041]|uniref:O-methyltransferase n=1 Tax=Mycobacterium sp. SM3041 TaxID=3114291 RepID=UPI0032047E0F